MKSKNSFKKYLLAISLGVIGFASIAPVAACGSAAVNASIQDEDICKKINSHNFDFKKVALKKKAEHMNDENIKNLISNSVVKAFPAAKSKFSNVRFNRKLIEDHNKSGLFVHELEVIYDFGKLKDQKFKINFFYNSHTDSMGCATKDDFSDSEWNKSIMESLDSRDIELQNQIGYFEGVIESLNTYISNGFEAENEQIQAFIVDFMDAISFLEQNQHPDPATWIIEQNKDSSKSDDEKIDLYVEDLKTKLSNWKIKIQNYFKEKEYINESSENLGNLEDLMENLKAGLKLELQIKAISSDKNEDKEVLAKELTEKCNLFSKFFSPWWKYFEYFSSTLKKRQDFIKQCELDQQHLSLELEDLKKQLEKISQEKKALIEMDPKKSITKDVVKKVGEVKNLISKNDTIVKKFEESEESTRLAVIRFNNDDSLKEALANSLIETIEKLEKEKVFLEGIINQDETEIKDLALYLKHFKENFLKLEEIKKELENEAWDNTEDFQKNKDKIEDYFSKIFVSLKNSQFIGSEELKTLVSELDTLKMNYNSCAKVFEELTDIKLKLNFYEQWKNQLETAENNQTELQQQITDLTTKNAELEKQLETAENNQTELQQQITDLTTKHAELEKQLETAENNQTELQQKITDLTTERDEVQNKLAIVQKEITDLTTKHDELKKQLETAENNQTELQQQITDLTTDRDELNEEKQELEEKRTNELLPQLAKNFEPLRDFHEKKQAELEYAAKIKEEQIETRIETYKEIAKDYLLKIRLNTEEQSLLQFRVNKNIEKVEEKYEIIKDLRKKLEKVLTGSEETSK